MKARGPRSENPLRWPRRSSASWRPRSESRARRALAWRGLDEAVTFSFISSDLAEAFGGVDSGLRLVNPISSDLDVMRPSVLPGLAAAAARNADRGFADVALFEVGPQYADTSPEGQSLVAAGLRAGRAGARVSGSFLQFVVCARQPLSGILWVARTASACRVGVAPGGGSSCSTP